MSFDNQKKIKLFVWSEQEASGWQQNTVVNDDTTSSAQFL